MLTGLVLTLASLAPAAEPDLKAFALKEAKPRIDAVLKAPATAKYEVGNDVQIPAGSVTVPGVHVVSGHVDSQNALGTPLRSAWTVIVRDGETPELLSVKLVTSAGKEHRLYLAPASRLYRAEVVDGVCGHFRASQARYAARTKTVPAKKKRMFLDRYMDEFLRECRREYGLDDLAVNAILVSEGLIGK